MKALSALFSALVVLGFAGAAAAQCSGYTKADQTAQAAPVIIVEEGSAGS